MRILQVRGEPGKGMNLYCSPVVKHICTGLMDDGYGNNLPMLLLVYPEEFMPVVKAICKEMSRRNIEPSVCIDKVGSEIDVMVLFAVKDIVFPEFLVQVMEEEAQSQLRRIVGKEKLRIFMTGEAGFTGADMDRFSLFIDLFKKVGHFFLVVSDREMLTKDTIAMAIALDTIYEGMPDIAKLMM